MTVKKYRILQDKAKNTEIYKKYRTAERTALHILVQQLLFMLHLSFMIDTEYRINTSMYIYTKIIINSSIMHVGLLLNNAAQVAIPPSAKDESGYRV